jgi:hypothetical protein
MHLDCFRTNPSVIKFRMELLLVVVRYSYDVNGGSGVHPLRFQRSARQRTPPAILKKEVLAS